MALSSLTGEIDTFTSSGSRVAAPKSKLATSWRPSICARCAGSLSPGGGRPLYAMSCSVLCKAWPRSGCEKRSAKYSWRPDAQPRVSRKPVTVPSARTRNRDQLILPG